MKIYPYDTTLCLDLLEIMDKRGWKLPDLIRWLGLPPSSVSRMISGPGNVTAEERSILLNKLAPLTWDYLSGEQDQRVVEETKALMLRNQTLWGRLNRWIGL